MIRLLPTLVQSVAFNAGNRLIWTRGSAKYFKSQRLHIKSLILSKINDILHSWYNWDNYPGWKILFEWIIDCTKTKLKECNFVSMKDCENIEICGITP